MVTTSISVIANNAERSDDVDTLLTLRAHANASRPFSKFRPVSPPTSALSKVPELGGGGAEKDGKKTGFNMVC